MAQKPGQSGEKGDSNLKSSSSKLRSMIEGSEDIFTKTWPYEDIKRFTDDFSGVIDENTTRILYKAHIHRTKVIIKKYLEPDIKYFLKEIGFLFKYAHPNVINLMGVCEENGNFLIFEDLSRGSLQDYIEKKEGSMEFSGEELLHTLLIVIQTINYLHGCGVLHREIKPSNILFDHYGKPKLAEFGRSKAIPEGKNTIDASIVSKSSQYEDPVFLQRNICGKFMDVYGFGLVMFTSLTRCPDPEKLNKLGKKIFDHGDYNGIRELFEHDWDDKIGMRLLSIMIDCTKLNHRNRPKADDVADQIEKIYEKILEEQESD